MLGKQFTSWALSPRNPCRPQKALWSVSVCQVLYGETEAER